MIDFEKPRIEDYENRLVAFIDVLGFKRLVTDISQNKQSFDSIADLLGFMKQAEENVRQQETYFKDVMESLEATAISDSLIISARFDPEQPLDILAFLYYIKSLQAKFLGEYKTLIRGYVCAGMMYHQDNVLFGKPYIRAYEAEKDVNGPKVAIDPDLESLIEQAESETKFTDEKELTRRDEDGWWFINYLQDPNKHKGNTSPYCYYLPEITEWLWKELRTQRGRTLEKYKWLYNYIDSLIRENKCPDAEVVSQAFPQTYSLTQTLHQYAGEKVYFQKENGSSYCDYLELFNIRSPETDFISSAVVPTKILDENFDISPSKITDVIRFLIELGAYPAEAEKIIHRTSGKTTKMKISKFKIDPK